jgi:hypothetical protein
MDFTKYNDVTTIGARVSTVLDDVNRTGNTIRTLSPYDEYVFTIILRVIHRYLDPIVLGLGLLGNILAFLVLLQPQYRNQTTCLYMRILAVYDTSIIVLKNIQVSIAKPVPFRHCREYRAAL